MAGVDPDITRAETIPSAFYTDAGVFDRVRERVFARSWQLVGDENLARVPGQAHPFTLLEGLLDEPLLLTRDSEDRLHCLSNVCTHRGNLVVEEAGILKHLRCRYHGRRFGLDGLFQQMPEFEGVCGFPSERDNLARLPLERWRGLLFTSLNPAWPLADALRPVQERTWWMPLEQARLESARSRDYLVRASWALYVDNYLEGFHIPFVHPGLAESLEYGSYRTELHPWGSLQIGIAAGGEPAFELPLDSPEAGARVAAYYFWVFPNLMLNFYPWGLSVNVVKPLAVARTRVSFLSYVWDESALDSGAGAELDRVEREDESVVEAVQKGVRSRFYDRGRYSPAREQGVHHFHRLLVETMHSGAETPSDVRPGARPG